MIGDLSALLRVGFEAWKVRRHELDFVPLEKGFQQASSALHVRIQRLRVRADSQEAELREGAGYQRFCLQPAISLGVIGAVYPDRGD